MTTDTDTWTKARSRLGNAVQKHGKDSPQAAQARAEFRALKLEDHVRQVLAEVPDMSDEKLERIAALLRAGGDA
jgi:hypothetical protein